MESCSGTPHQALAPLPGILLGTGTVTEHWSCSKHPMEHWSCSGTSYKSLVLLWDTAQVTSTTPGLDTTPTYRGERQGRCPGTTGATVLWNPQSHSRVVTTSRSGPPW